MTRKINRQQPSSISPRRLTSAEGLPVAEESSAALQLAFGSGTRQFAFGSGTRQFAFGSGTRQFVFGSGTRQFS